MNESNGQRADSSNGIPYTKDPDGVIAAGIEELWPLGDPDCSPRGRVYANDLDAYCVYREMYRLLTGETETSGPAEYGQRLNDLANSLVDLHEEGVQAFEDFQAARWGW